MARMYGSTEMDRRSTVTPLSREATNRLTPIGGVRSPTSFAMTMTTPKWIGWMSS